jgi:hypothetical protein
MTFQTPSQISRGDGRTASGGAVDARGGPPRASSPACVPGDDDEDGSVSGRRAEYSGPWLLHGSARRSLGRRLDLPGNPGRVALSGGNSRSWLTPGRRLVAGRRPGDEAALKGSPDGSGASGCREASPLRSRLPVCQRRLPVGTGQARHRVQHEPTRQLLGQCSNGELLFHPQARACPPVPVANSRFSISLCGRPGRGWLFASRAARSRLDAFHHVRLQQPERASLPARSSPVPFEPSGSAAPQRRARALRNGRVGAASTRGTTAAAVATRDPSRGRSLPCWR